LVTHVQQALPKFMLKTPGMKRRKKRIGDLVSRIMAAHTPTQRAGCPRDIMDDVLSLHAADPQFLPETDLPFSLVSPQIVSLYMGNAMSFVLYNLLRRPELYRQIQDEADRVFAAGDPFRFEMASTDYQLRINPFPTMSPTRKMKLRIAERGMS